jgi:hypothetical protein
MEPGTISFNAEVASVKANWLTIYPLENDTEINALDKLIKDLESRPLESINSVFVNRVVKIYFKKEYLKTVKEARHKANLKVIFTAFCIRARFVKRNVDINVEEQLKHLPYDREDFPSTNDPLELKYLSYYIFTMKELLCILEGHNHQGLFVGVSALIEGSGKVYRTGGQPTKETRRRQAIYFHLAHVTPVPKKRPASVALSAASSSDEELLHNAYPATNINQKPPVPAPSRQSSNSSISVAPSIAEPVFPSLAYNYNVPPTLPPVHPSSGSINSVLIRNTPTPPHTPTTPNTYPPQYLSTIPASSTYYVIQQTLPYPPNSYPIQHPYSSYPPPTALLGYPTSNGSSTPSHSSGTSPASVPLVLTHTISEDESSYFTDDDLHSWLSDSSSLDESEAYIMQDAKRPRLFEREGILTNSQSFSREELRNIFEEDEDVEESNKPAPMLGMLGADRGYMRPSGSIRFNSETSITVVSNGNDAQNDTIVKVKTEGDELARLSTDEAINQLFKQPDQTAIPAPEEDDCLTRLSTEDAITQLLDDAHDFLDPLPVSIDHSF